MHDTMSETGTKRFERAKTTLKKSRLRITLSLTLSLVASARIKDLAAQRGCSRSRVVEELVGGVDYPEMFSLFACGATFEQIVIQTRQPPAIVRAVYADYKAGLDGPAVVVTPPAPVKELPPVRSIARR